MMEDRLFLSCNEHLIYVKSDFEMDCYGLILINDKIMCLDYIFFIVLYVFISMYLCILMLCITGKFYVQHVCFNNCVNN